MERNNLSSHKKDWKKLELNNESIALNILYVPHNIKEIRHAYKSKYNLVRENQVILLMIVDGKNGLSALFRGITSNNNGDFYCLNRFHSFSTT